MRLNRFGTRAPAALALAALVLFAHERYHLRVLQLLAGAALIVWAVLEIRHAHGRGHASPVGDSFKRA